MNSRISVGISVLVIVSALSGCLVSSGGDANAVGATSDGTDDNETRGPTAVLAITVNGTEVYSSEDAEGSSGATGTATTTATGNTTAASNTTGAGSASASATASASASPTASASSSPSATTSSAGNTSSAGGNATDGNGTSNGTDSGVSIEPNVNVTFDASDSEGTNLTFSWAIGNFTSENETFDYVFNETGTFNVTLTVTDLLNATDEETVTITVGNATGAGKSGPAGDRTQTFTPAPTGGYFIGAPNCLQGGSQAQATYTWTILDVDENGSAVKAVKLAVTAEHGSAGVAHRLTLNDPEGNKLGEGTEVTVEGEFPAGDYTIIYRLCGPLSSSGSSETFATASYVYA